jgi:predicted permease
MRDLIHALRVLRKNAGFSAAAVLVLALGIGANTAIFSVVYAVLLKPLPYRDPGKLVVALHQGQFPASPADYLDYRAEVHAFSAMAAAQAWNGTMEGREKAEVIPGIQVSSNMMGLLGVAPVLGRAFLPDEDQAGAKRVLVLGYALWKNRFAGDAGIVGRTVRLSDLDYTVIGVMPQGFQFAPFWQTEAAMWTPLVLSNRLNDRDGRSLRVFARLAPGVSLQAAQTQMDTVARRLQTAYPKTNAQLDISVVPLHEKVVGAIRPTLLLLLATVGLVLIIACADMTNLLLTRAAGRTREVAVRLAIGARRIHIIRQMAVESLVLAAMGGAGGLLLARVGLGLLSAALPQASLPRQQEVGIDAYVLIFTVAIALFAGLISGLIPAIQASRCDLNENLKEGARGSSGGRRGPFQGILVTVQVALALVLLISATLMMKTLHHLNEVDAGFNPEKLLTVQVYAPKGTYNTPEKRISLFSRLGEQLSAVTGVRSVSSINHLPISGDLWNFGYEVLGRAAPPPGQGFSAVYRVVRPRYFETMGIPFAGGRDFSDRDNEHAPAVVIINQAMALHQWRGEDPVGRQIRMRVGPQGTLQTLAIVGIVKNARQSDWTGEPADEVYLPYLQKADFTSLAFVVRTSVKPEALMGPVERSILSVDRTIPLSHIETMERVIGNKLWRSRVSAFLLTVFAGIALVLTAVGIYGVIAYAVGRRTQEIGIRIALGATRAGVLALVLGEGMRPVVAGIALGVALAVATTRLLSSLLYGVSATDVWTFTGIVASVALTSVLATAIPVLRALRADPVSALRHE